MITSLPTVSFSNNLCRPTSVVDVPDVMARIETPTSDLEIEIPPGRSSQYLSSIPVRDIFFCIILLCAECINFTV